MGGYTNIPPCPALRVYFVYRPEFVGAHPGQERRELHRRQECLAAA